MRRKKRKPKKAFDYEPGELLWEGEKFSPGRIMSMRSHPRRPMVYFLCRNDKNEYTIMVALADATCEPWVARHIPGEIMDELFMDAFVGYILPKPVMPERFRRRTAVILDAPMTTTSRGHWVPAVDL